jgi:hypothetical protein
MNVLPHDLFDAVSGEWSPAVRLELAVDVTICSASGDDVGTEHPPPAVPLPAGRAVATELHKLERQ